MYKKNFFLNKYKLYINIFAVLLFSLVAINKLFIENNWEKKNWNLFEGIVFISIAIYKLTEVIKHFQKARRFQKSGIVLKNPEEYGKIF